MNKKFFCFLVSLIILFGFVSKIFALKNGNIYFTVDEGRDAIYVREILNFHTFFAHGPQSSVAGIFTGPLWYYFIAIGYGVAHGNPIGAPLMLTILNITVILVIIYVVKKEVDWGLALIIACGLTIFWPFFSTSLYGFNPFPLCSLSIILILLLVKGKYGLALIPILLAFNTELAGAVCFLIFYILVGIYLVASKKLSRIKFFLCALIIPSLGVTKIVFDYLKTPRISQSAGLKVFVGTNFLQMAKEFVKMIGQSVFHQIFLVGFIVFVVIIIFYFKLKKKNEWSYKFICLSLSLVFVSYLFFGSNHGWREWQTVYVSPLIFISTLLMLWQFKGLRYLLIGSIFILQFLIFKDNYINYLKPKLDRSLLYNQEKVLDWIYTHNEGNGFNLYTYTDSFYDYSYQYLISWYTLPKYGFYPCEYANFPLSHKYLYIPGASKYNYPTLGCDKFRFLIVDSATNGNENKNWINDFRDQTILVTKIKIGDTLIEKRKVPDKIR